MRNVIMIVTVFALCLAAAGLLRRRWERQDRPPDTLNTATAPLSSTRDTRLSASAPVGHRQPRARDIPSQNPSDLERLTEEDATVDRKLTHLSRLLR